MHRDLKYLNDLFPESGSIDFDGVVGQDYALIFKHLLTQNSIFAALADGNHKFVGSALAGNVSSTFQFGHGQTDVWLFGENSWERLSIDGGNGDHAILIDKIALSGAQISLGDGDSLLDLGTSEGDTKTKVTGGNGNFRVKANDLGTVALGHGDHLVTVGEASLINVGDGSSYISFKGGSDSYATHITAGNGNHTLIGMSVASGTPTKVEFGNGVDGGGSVLQLDGLYGNTTVTGGTGNHSVQIEKMSQGKIALGTGVVGPSGDMLVNIKEVSSIYGVIVELGEGDHRVHVGTNANDKFTAVSAGDGNSEVKIGTASKVTLGDGSHVIGAGDVATITVGHGGSQIAFEASSQNFGNRITAGDGSHTIVGTSTSTKASTTNVKVGDGDINGDGSYIHLAGWHSSATVRAGDGDHTVTVDSTKMGWVTLGQGNHVVDVTAEGTNSSAIINIGDGNTDLTVSGTGHVTMGAGNHVIAAHDVTSIRTGAGEQQIFFEDGLNFSGTAIYAMGGGDDVVVGLGLDERPRANVQTYDGDDTIVLLNGNWSGTNVGGGAGFDTLYVDERAKNSLYLNGIEKVVYLSSDLSIEEALEIAGVSHPDYQAAPEPVLTPDDIFIDDSALLDAGVIEPDQPADGVVLADIQPMEWFDLDRQGFVIKPLPDPEDPDSVDLELVDMSGAKKKPDNNDEFDPASREDRLMEPTSDFFQRSEAYKRSFETDVFDTFYDVVQYNDFGDFVGTNQGDTIEELLGDSQIFAMGGNDLIEGNDGQDRIYGGDGNDTVKGGAGQDLLDGGHGYDVLVGGEDIDIFVFRKGEGTTDIADFELSYDILDVEGFDNLTYEDLTDAGRQVGADVYYELGDDMLILRNAELSTMLEVDLCMR